MYVVAGPGTRKARNLEAHPACTVAVSLPGMDLVLEGTAASVAPNPAAPPAGAWNPDDLPGLPVVQHPRRLNGSDRSGTEKRPVARRL